MRTSFGHQENLVTATLEASAHPDLGFAPAILPAVVVEGDAAVHRLMNDLYRSFFVGRVSEMVPAEAESGDSCIGATEFS